MPRNACLSDCASVRGGRIYRHSCACAYSTCACGLVDMSSFSAGPTQSDFSDLELVSESELDYSTESESDLDDLYESFDYEEEVPLEARSDTARDGTDSASCLANLASISQCSLYSGPQITTLQSYLLIFQDAIRHSLTMKSFTELLQLLSVDLPPTATILRSVHKLKRVFVECFPDSQVNNHFYCDCCHRPLPSASATCSEYGCSVEGKTAVFITVPLGPQLKRMMGGE